MDEVLEQEGEQLDGVSTQGEAIRSSKVVKTMEFERAEDVGSNLAHDVRDGILWLVGKDNLKSGKYGLLVGIVVRAKEGIFKAAKAGFECGPIIEIGAEHAPRLPALHSGSFFGNGPFAVMVKGWCLEAFLEEGYGIVPNVLGQVFAGLEDKNAER